MEQDPKDLEMLMAASDQEVLAIARAAALANIARMKRGHEKRPGITASIAKLIKRA